MKVRKKARGQTEMEKRNTSILTFVSFALIPLVLTMILGFSLKQTDVVNKDKLFQKLESLQAQIDDLEENNRNLDKVFAKADTVLERFVSKEIKVLEDDLKDIKSKIDLEEWEKDREEKIRDFKRNINRIEAPFDFSESLEKNRLLNFGKAWLEEYAEVKNIELYAKQLIREQEIELTESSELENQDQDLQIQLMQKNMEIAGLNREIETYKGNAEEDKTDFITKYQSLLSANEKTKTNINAEIKDIEDKILPDLRKLVFKNKFEKLKNQLETKINNIKIESGYIKTEQ